MAVSFAGAVGCSDRKGRLQSVKFVTAPEFFNTRLCLQKCPAKSGTSPLAAS